MAGPHSVAPSTERPHIPNNRTIRHPPRSRSILLALLRMAAYDVPMADLPIKTTLTPADQTALASAVAQAFADGSALYPIGGGTSLEFGLPAKAPGSGLSLSGLNRVVDYPARDLTVTVEAGVTMQTLADLLAKEGQRLPLDVPQPAKATVGGVVATNWNGPRRYG